MNPRLKFISYIFLSGSISFTSCKKNNPISHSAPPIPAKATINFHIKDTNSSGWGEPVYLYRLDLTSTSNQYDSSQNIYLRPNIDSSFIYQVTGNTNNLFTVGSDPFNGILIYMEQKFIAAGSNTNWEITY